MSSRVTFYLMRHPVHVDDEVAEEGFKQIQLAARKLLTPVERFHYVFSTEKKRAMLTATSALQSIGKLYDNLPIRVETYFGFGYLEEECDALYPFPDAVKEVEHRRAAGQFVSVQDMLTDIYPPAMVVRHVLRATMAQWAERFTRRRRHGDVNVLVGNHASSVFAVLDPEHTDGHPPYCSVAVYTWEVDELGVADLVSSELLVP